ncbi:MAG: acyltransferase [Lentisphaerae bacterium GWF2_57_35]|nr:MAG: acyltransferase [Lentisphaerae bacterium GWF2_57_35]
MLFNSLNFLVFFLLVYGLYLALPHRAQNILLLLASYFFYGCWDWRFLSLIAISTVIDYWAGRKISSTDGPKARKFYLLISLFSNLLILGFFKYFNFFVSNADALLHFVGFDASAWRLNIVLPVGISFYTFQTMSYTIDVYRRELNATKNFIDFATFVAFFPQLVAGPIERASKLLPQIAGARQVSWRAIQTGLWLIFWGLFKKVVIADNLAEMVDEVFGWHVQFNAGTVFLGLYAFAFQIYCDFSGYSDIARGLSRCMGIELMVNFNNPYFAPNVSNFWRRWHISLSTWLRDYLYIPLGGNQKGIGRTYANLILTMLLGGLWHGAAWTYVVWGGYHGVLLSINRLFASRREKKLVPLPEYGWGRVVRVIITFHLVLIGWLFFRAVSLDQAFDMLLSAIRSPVVDPDVVNKAIAMCILCMPLWLVQILQERKADLMAVFQLPVFARSLLYFTLFMMLLVFGNTGSHQFIYFQF